MMASCSQMQHKQRHFAFNMHIKFNLGETTMKPKKIRAILFDCDGVIINSAADIADAVNATLKAHGMRPVSYTKMRTFVGNGSVALVERAIKNSKRLEIESPLPIPQTQFKKIHAEYLQYYYSHAIAKTKLYPGFEKMLAKLNAKGIRMGIVTNKPTKILRQILKHFKIEKYFDALIGPEQVKNLKPAPDGIFAALEKINQKIQSEIKRKSKKDSDDAAAEFIPIAPEETIMVGDSYTDIGAGHAAGTFTVAVLGGMGDKEKMLAQKPDLQIQLAAQIVDAAMLDV